MQVRIHSHLQQLKKFKEVFGMLKITNSFLLFFLSLLLVTCATTSNEKNDINEPGALDLIICEEPRPQICTREYNPVCGKLQDGSTVTGSTGCTSCSDPKVVGYKMGACEIVSSGQQMKPVSEDNNFLYLTVGIVLLFFCAGTPGAFDGVEQLVWCDNFGQCRVVHY